MCGVEIKYIFEKKNILIKNISWAIVEPQMFKQADSIDKTENLNFRFRLWREARDWLKFKNRVLISWTTWCTYMDRIKYVTRIYVLSKPISRSRVRKTNFYLNVDGAKEYVFNRPKIRYCRSLKEIRACKIFRDVSKHFLSKTICLKLVLHLYILIILCLIKFWQR